MNVSDHFSAIRSSIAIGNINEAVDKLQFLSNKSSLLKAVIMQKARLNDLNKVLVGGTISFEQGSITKSQITSAVLDLADALEKEIQNNKDIQTELGLTVEEFINKFGLNRALLNAHANNLKNRKYACLWIDDMPENDNIEMSILAALDIQPMVARNPYDAYRLIRDNRPDVIVINSLSRLRDYENEGIEFCEFLSKNLSSAEIPIIMHSVSLQKRIAKDANVVRTLPPNIKNDFSSRNALIIRDLIEEIIVNLGPGMIRRRSLQR